MVAWILLLLYILDSRAVMRCAIYYASVKEVNESTNEKDPDIHVCKARMPWAMHQWRQNLLQTPLVGYRSDATEDTPKSTMLQ